MLNVSLGSVLLPVLVDLQKSLAVHPRNPRLRAKKVLVKPEGGTPHYATRWVAPEDDPQMSLFGPAGSPKLFQHNTPKPKPDAASTFKPMEATSKKKAGKIQPSGPSLFDALGDNHNAYTHKAPAVPTGRPNPARDVSDKSRPAAPALRPKPDGHGPSLFDSLDTVPAGDGGKVDLGGRAAEPSGRGAGNVGGNLRSGDRAGSQPRGSDVSGESGNAAARSRDGGEQRQPVTPAAPRVELGAEDRARLLAGPVKDIQKEYAAAVRARDPKAPALRDLIAEHAKQVKAAPPIKRAKPPAAPAGPSLFDAAEEAEKAPAPAPAAAPKPKPVTAKEPKKPALDGKAETPQNPPADLFSAPPVSLPPKEAPPLPVGDAAAELVAEVVGEAADPERQEAVAQAVEEAHYNPFQAAGLEDETERNTRDVVLSEEDRIGQGSLREKAADNFAAMDLLATIKAENRSATPEEQKVLARFVGWGAFGQAFQDKFAPYANYEWDKLPYYARRSMSQSDEAHFNLFKEIKARLGDDDFERARHSIKNAHYTSPKVVKAMWDALRHMGFQGGRVLEPSMGAGNFFGFMPKDMASRSIRTGVELDTTTGAIAQQLYPDARIHVKGLQDTPLPDNGFDLVIGNVPFGDYGVTDAEYLKKGRKAETSRIHNYFISKSLDKVRPGGVVAVITSSYTMDAQRNKSNRELWGDKAHFLGSMRLPNDAFDESAGTRVTTDVIFLQKKDPVFEGLHPRDAMGRFIKKWTGIVDAMATRVRPRYGDDGDVNTRESQEEVKLNEYFAENPEMMLGKLTVGNGQYSDDQTSLVSDGRPIEEAMAQATQSLPSNIFYKPDEATAARMATENEAQLAGKEIKAGAFHVDGDKIFINHGGRLIEQEAHPEGRDKTKRARIVGQYNLLAQVREHLKLEQTATGRLGDDNVRASREDLNAAYDAFVKEFGSLHSRANAGAFSSDPDHSLLLSLEHRNKETGEMEKGDVFRKRVIDPGIRATTAATPRDAMMIALAETGCIDWVRISGLLGERAADARDELAKAGLIYRNPANESDPTTAGWETADAYLSGKVKEKLRLAQTMAESDPSYLANVEALEAVQPPPIPAHDVKVQLGAHWVPQEMMRGFVDHLIGEPHSYTLEDYPTVQYTRANGWKCNALKSSDKRKDSAAFVSQWGTKDRNALKILESVLQMRDLTITRKDAEGNTYVDQTATDLAREKAELMKEEWQKWIESSSDRQLALAALYNETFNDTVERQYDGSHLTFPGMAVGWQSGFRQHCKDAVWRALQTGTCLFDHVVGGGKTGCMAATIMEMRRLGMAKKPMIVVRNPQLESFEKEFREIYPNAKLLVVGGMGNAAKRKELTAQIATGDWDAVIVAQSTFKEMPASPKLHADFLAEQVADLRAALLEETMQDEANAEGGKTGKSRSQKQIEGMISTLETKIKNLHAQIANRQDDGLFFDELGIDAMCVDEAHDYKNLMFATRMTRLAGINPAGSQKAQDMFVKTQHMLKKTGGKGLIFATGTPVANSIAELWTMKRYLMMGELKEKNLHRFDSWAANFAVKTTKVEKAPEGGFRQRTRLSRFVNVPEMMSMYRSIADVKTVDDLAHILPRPEILGGEPQTVTAPPSEAMSAYMNDLMARAEAIKEKKVTPDVDNMLKITTDGRKASLDMRLIDAGLGEEDGSKVHLCAENVARIHKETADRKATQLVFLDLGTPSTKSAKQEEEEAEASDEAQDGEEGEENFSHVYGSLKEKIVAGGVPEHEVAFVHDFKTPAARKEMQAKVKSGEIRVLIGSRMKMGVGINVQDRLYANHHLDCPWKPGELEQADGRILRQGNMHHKSQWDIPVQILRYGTKGSFDEYMWQTVSNKARFIAQVRSSAPGRECDDVDETTMSYAAMTACLTDDPRLKEKNELEETVHTLQRAYAGHRAQTLEAASRLASLPGRRQALLEEADHTGASAAHYAQHGPKDKDGFELHLGNERHDKRDGAGDHLGVYHEETPDFESNLIGNPGGHKIGHYCGFDIVAKPATKLSEAFDPAKRVGNMAVAYELRSPDGRTRLPIAAGANGGSTVARMDNALRGLAGRSQNATAEAERLVTEMEQYKAMKDQPFTKQKDLDAASTRLAALLKELSKGSDADAAASADAADDDDLEKSLARLAGAAHATKAHLGKSLAVDGGRLVFTVASAPAPVVALSPLQKIARLLGVERQ